MSKLTSLGVITMESNKEPKDRETAAGSKLGRVAKDFFLGCIAFIPLAVFVFIFYYQAHTFVGFFVFIILTFFLKFKFIPLRTICKKP